MVFTCSAASSAAGGLVLKNTADYVMDVVSHGVFSAKSQKLKGQLECLKQEEHRLYPELRVLKENVSLSRISESAVSSAHYINNHFDFLIKLQPGDNSRARRWALDMLSQPEGIEYHLSALKNLIYGKIPSAENPLLLDYFFIINEKRSRNQSCYFMLMNMFKMLITLQKKGMIIYLNACTLLKDGKIKPDTLMKEFEKDLKEQGDLCRKILSEHQVNPWYFKIPDTKSCFEIHRSKINRFVNASENMAPEGHIITGMKLEMRNNIICLKVRHAPFTRKLTSPCENQWKDAVEEPELLNAPFIDLNTSTSIHSQATEIPEGCVVTGAKLGLKENQLVMKLHYNHVKTEEEGAIQRLIPTSGQWAEPPGGNNNRFEIYPLHSFFMNSHEMNPEPVSPINGAKFIQGGNIFDIQLKTSCDAL